MIKLVSELNVTASNAIQTVSGLSNPELVIELSADYTFQSGSLIEPLFKSGNVFNVRWVQGDFKGKLIGLSYGISELIFDIPDPLSSYSIELVPGRLQFNYQIKLFTKVFNPAYTDLTERLGIPLELLEKLPEQLLITLQGIKLMAGSDTRKLQADLQALASTTAAADTKASNALDAVTTVEDELISAKAEMIQSREFELTQSSFVLGTNEFGPCYIATVTHNLVPNTVVMSLVDEDGDEQGYSQLIVNRPGMPDKAMVELSLPQYTENNFPLNFVLHGQIGTAIASNWILAEGNGVYYRIDQGQLQQSMDGETQFGVNLGSDITEAFIDIMQGRVYGKDGLNDCFYWIIGSYTPIPLAEAEYNSAKNVSGLIFVSSTGNNLNGVPVLGTNFKVRLNRQISKIQRALIGTENWEPIRDDQNIQAAKLGTDGRIDCLLIDGLTYVWTDVNGSAWQGSNAVYHDTVMTAINGAIVL